MLTHKCKLLLMNECVCRLWLSSDIFRPCSVLAALIKIILASVRLAATAVTEVASELVAVWALLLFRSGSYSLSVLGIRERRIPLAVSSLNTLIDLEERQLDCSHSSNGLQRKGTGGDGEMVRHANTQGPWSIQRCRTHVRKHACAHTHRHTHRQFSLESGALKRVSLEPPPSTRWVYFSILFWSCYYFHQNPAVVRVTICFPTYIYTHIKRFLWNLMYIYIRFWTNITDVKSL